MGLDASILEGELASPRRGPCHGGAVVLRHGKPRRHRAAGRILRQAFGLEAAGLKETPANQRIAWSYSAEAMFNGSISNRVEPIRCELSEIYRKRGASPDLDKRSIAS